MISSRIALAVAIVLGVTPTLAQNTPVASSRATIQTISADGSALKVHTRAGEDQTVHLNPKTRFVLVVPAALTDVKPGSFIGVAALPGEGSELKAMEVHIFPEAMRGTGEGFRPFDLAPKSSMTNGNISARVDAATGSKLTVTYKGGEQTIVVDPKTPIVALEPGAKTDLKPGAAIIARGPKQADGSIDAAFVLVGKDGLVPPM
ncbi:MAG: DUF5666 domain-containing protein [Roseiarcus sp.]